MDFNLSRPQGDSVGWDPSQFKLQPDGTFRISIRGMAAMAGVDDSALSRSLKSAAAENRLPCARSLVAQGFDPAAVSTWGETGGIPEDAAPFILEHYGITAASPSPQARAVLLAFSRVGINAYLKERLGVSQARDTQPLALSSAETVGATARVICEIHQMIADHTPGLVDARMEVELKRDLLLLKSVAVQAATGMLPGTSDVLSPQDKLPRFMGVVVDPEMPIGVTEFFLQLNDSNLSKVVTNNESELGRRTKAGYRLRYDKEPDYSNGYLGERRMRRGFPLLFPTKTGKNVPIACYVPHDWDLIVHAAREMGLLRPDMAARLLAECQQFRLGMDD